MVAKRLTRAQAIKAKCMDCSGFQFKEVKLCPVTHCPLHIYRMGYEVDAQGVRVRNPKKQRENKAEKPAGV